MVWPSSVSEVVHQFRFPLEVTLNIVKMDGLAADVEHRFFSLAVALGLHNEDGKHLVALQFLVKAPLPDPRLVHLDTAPGTIFVSNLKPGTPSAFDLDLDPTSAVHWPVTKWKRQGPLT